MGWILLATAGQFLNAVVAVLDKYIVSDKNLLPRPFVYAFYTCLLTGSWLLVYVFGLLPLPEVLNVPTYANVEHPTLIVVALSFLAAYTMFLALVSMYDALKHADASDVMPAIGAVAAIASFVFNYYFLDGDLSNNFVAGIILLVLGTAMVSRARLTRPLIQLILHSGIFFAFHLITMKGLFLETSFDNAFFWSRVSLILFSLSLLLIPAYLELITGQTSKTSLKAGVLVVVTKVLAGIAGFMLLKATDWGDVTVVQALDGVKFVFILLLAYLLSPFLPKSASDHLRGRHTLWQKVVFVGLITVGFVILFI